MLIVHKWLKGKEMDIHDSDRMRQIQCPERDTGGEERGKGGLGARGRGVFDRVKLAAPEIEGLGLGAVERAGAPPAEDGELVAGLVDSTISINALRNC